MADRIEKKELVRRVAARMGTGEAEAAAWVEGILEEMYDTFRSGQGLTLPGFGGFYLERKGRPHGLQVQSGAAPALALRLVVHVQGLIILTRAPT